MGTTRLQLYNDALQLCGERFLSALSDTGEARRQLDQVWSSNGVNYCLEQGQWQFAMRTQQVEVDESFGTPDFGYRYAFTKPEDWIRTSAVCSDAYFRSPLLRYSDEMGHWFADIQPIYVKFVSSDSDYGGDLSLWPASFCAYAAAYFASKIIARLGGERAEQKALLFGVDGKGGTLDRTLTEAKSQAASTQPTQFFAEGSWVQSRRSRRGYGPFGDGGTSGSLTG